MEENRIELFERYVNDTLSDEEKGHFESILNSDRGLLGDFRLYLLTIKGIIQEEEQRNLDFGIAMKNISSTQLKKIIGTYESKAIKRNYFWRRFGWISSYAAVLIIALFAVLHVRKNGMDKVDDIIVAYNYIPETNRGFEEFSTKNIKELEISYRTLSDDDVQNKQVAGMRLAMAYLKVHDRKKAKQILEDMCVRFRADEEFKAQCENILEQL